MSSSWNDLMCATLNLLWNRSEWACVCIVAVVAAFSSYSTLLLTSFWIIFIAPTFQLICYLTSNSYTVKEREKAANENKKNKLICQCYSKFSCLVFQFILGLKLVRQYCRCAWALECMRACVCACVFSLSCYYCSFYFCCSEWKHSPFIQVKWLRHLFCNLVQVWFEYFTRFFSTSFFSINIIVIIIIEVHHV